MLFDKFINSVAMAKTTFFSKTLKTQARFSPRRDVYLSWPMANLLNFWGLHRENKVQTFISGSIG